jgi:septal ring factor EnvC (AmiA/AmiB activator)
VQFSDMCNFYSTQKKETKNKLKRIKKETRCTKKQVNKTQGRKQKNKQTLDTSMKNLKRDKGL